MNETEFGEDRRGGLERGLTGDYELNLSALFSEAWGLVSGNKGLIWMAMLFYLGLAFLIGMFFGVLNTPPVDASEMQPPSIMEAIGNLVSALVLMPMAVGLGFLATAVAMGQRPNPKSLFAWYGHTLKIFLTGLLMNLLILLGFLLLVLPGVYLAVSYQIALPLMVDKKLGPWQALEASRKIIGHHFFTVLGFDLVALVVVTLSMLLLGIPFIWTVPMLVIAFGIIYRNTVGLEADTLDKVLAT